MFSIFYLMHNNMNKTQKNGGKKLGKGKSGTVYTIKGEKDSISEMMIKKDLKEIILEFKNKSQHLDVNVFDSFKEFIESLDDDHVCKYFYTKNAEKEFNNEILGYKHALKTNTTKKLSVGNFGIKYKSDILLGFVFIYPKTKKHFTIMDKCEIDLKKCILNKIFLEEKEFKKLFIEIIQQIIKIQKLNIAHGDIKLDNIMKCNHQYKLIDWGYMRDLDYDKLRNSDKPILGSCSLYFKIYGENHKGYVNGVPWKTAYKILSKMKLSEMSVSSYLYNKSTKYLNHSNDYYKEQYTLYDNQELFDHLKYGLDLHAFGWILYDILIKNEYKEKYMNLILNLYKFHPKDALKIFKTL